MGPQAFPLLHTLSEDTLPVNVSALWPACYAKRRTPLMSAICHTSNGKNLFAGRDENKTRWIDGKANIAGQHLLGV
jgi:hypothetical protein